jgi:catechol 2,3-dioxygenase-like lactoylglutathione lyase family enzyme
MIKLDPIIAVKDVEASSKWYEELFGFKRAHGGSGMFAVLKSKDEIVLCLHAWKSHEHPTMADPEITAGNGLILYFRADNLKSIRKMAEKYGVEVEEDIHLNKNSNKNEFSLRDPDGYYLTITEYHIYEG